MQMAITGQNSQKLALQWKGGERKTFGKGGLTRGTTMGVTVLSDIWRHIWGLVPSAAVPFMNLPTFLQTPYNAMQCLQCFLENTQSTNCAILC